MSMYDLIIVGAGPAGMTAGVYAARKKLKTLIITKDIGGQAAWSHDIENYPGFAMIAGSDLAEKFEHHLEGFKDSVELKLSAKGVSKIEKADKHFSIDLADGSSYSSKTVIIAGGKVPRPLNVSGEKDFLNRGVTYCSWCDGPLFRGKEVAIIGGGNSALDAALNVQKFVKQIYIVNLTPQLTADKVMVDKVKAALHMRILNNTEVVQIKGQKTVTAIVLKDKQNGNTKELPVEGVFVEIGSLPATNYLKGLVRLNKQGEVTIDSANKTSASGIYAAGDITDVPEKQIIIAAGEGAKAAIQAAKFLARQD